MSDEEDRGSLRDRRMEDLKDGVLQHSHSGTGLARRIGFTAIPWLREQAMTHSDERVRHAAIWYLSAIGGPGVTEVCLQVLFEGSTGDRLVAVGYLREHATPVDLARLLRAYDQNADPLIRSGLALAIGRIDEAVAVQALRQRREQEPNSQVQEALVTALARLNDKDAQTEFVSRLWASAGRDRRRYIEHCKYIRGRQDRQLGRDHHRRRARAHWLLKPLAPLLDDETTQWDDDEETKAMDRAFRVRPPHPDFVTRPCDWAVDLVASISGRRFTFPVASFGKRYNELQRAEVRRYLYRRSE